MDLLSDALRVQHDAFMDQLDLVLKWITLRLCEKENVKAMSQVLRQVYSKLFQSRQPEFSTTESNF